MGGTMTPETAPVAPMHITQLIPKGELFRGRNSGQHLIAQIARQLVNGPFVNQRWQPDKRSDDADVNDRALHHIAIAEHFPGKDAGDVLATYTIWKQWWEQDDDRDDEITIRMARGLLNAKQVLHSGFGVVHEGRHEDPSDLADVAVNLYFQITAEMECRRRPPTRNYTIHRVLNRIPTEAYYWSDWII